MTTQTILEDIKEAIENAPRNGYIAELHIQVIKHSEALQDITGKEFCAALDIGPSFGTEFAKMKKIAPRLKNAGLNADKL